MRKLTLIWDFRGSDAEKTAKHHLVHLKEYAIKNDLDIDVFGSEDLTQFHSIAFLVVNENEMIPIRDALKPNQGQLFQP